MLEYDLCVAWNWEYDGNFIALLELGCRSKGLTLIQVTPNNLAESLHYLAEKKIHCRAFFDRASDMDAQFMPLVQWMHENRIFTINPYERALLTWDKAQMHTQLVAAGLDVPHTVILPAFFEQPELPVMDPFAGGESYTIKPAHGSGGIGVSTCSSWEQVLLARQEHAADQYLLQAHVVPRQLELRPAWFRVIYCTGKTYPCWWNPLTHVYAPVTAEEKILYGLERLDDIAAVISRICGLDLFSTEIALTHREEFLVVDYVNDQIDLRLQSAAQEGVPDSIVQEIAERLVDSLLHVD